MKKLLFQVLGILKVVLWTLTKITFWIGSFLVIMVMIAQGMEAAERDGWWLDIHESYQSARSSDYGSSFSSHPPRTRVESECWPEDDWCRDDYPSYRDDYPSYRDDYPSYRDDYPSYRDDYPSYRDDYPSYRDDPLPRTYFPAQSDTEWVQPSYDYPMYPYRTYLNPRRVYERDCWDFDDYGECG